MREFFFEIQNSKIESYLALARWTRPQIIPSPLGCIQVVCFLTEANYFGCLKKLQSLTSWLYPNKSYCQMAFPMYGPGRHQLIWSGRSEIFVVSQSAAEHDGMRAVIPCWKLRRLQTSSSYIGSTVREHVSHRLSEKILIRTRNFVGCRWDLRP